MAIFGPFPGVFEQFPATRGFEVGVEYVKRVLTEGSEERGRLFALPIAVTERVGLSDGVFALEEAYLSKSDHEVRWEAHRHYLDLQVVVAGYEVMEVADVGMLSVEEDLSPARDLQYYAGPARASVLRVGEGSAAVFFPVDAHRPGLAAGDPQLVRKVVVKIPL
jgi:biofilm protein TabA